MESEADATSRGAGTERRYRLVLWGIVIATALLWFRLASVPAIWMDEFASLKLAAYPYHDILEFVGWERSPPLYFLYLHGWMAGLEWIGGSAVAISWLRLSSILPALGTLVLLSLLARRRWGWEAALAAAIIAAATPTIVFYSLELRAYSLTILVASADLWLLVRLLERPQFRRAVALGLMLGLGQATHYYLLSITFECAAWSALVFLRRGGVPRTRRFAAILSLPYAIAALLFLPLTGILKGQFALNESAGGMVASGRPEFLRNLLFQLPFGPIESPFDTPAIRFGLEIGIVLVVVLTLAMLRNPSRRGRGASGRTDLLWPTASFLAIAHVIGSSCANAVGLTPILTGRLLVLGVPAFILAMIGLLVRIRQARPRYVLFGAWLALSGLACVASVSSRWHSRNHLKIFQAHEQPGAVTVPIYFIEHSLGIWLSSLFPAHAVRPLDAIQMPVPGSGILIATAQSFAGLNTPADNTLLIYVTNFVRDHQLPMGAITPPTEHLSPAIVYWRIPPGEVPEFVRMIQHAIPSLPPLAGLERFQK